MTEKTELKKTELERLDTELEKPDHILGQGVLFYSTVYIHLILFIVFAVTGRWIFLLLIVFTLGLTGFMNYLILHNPMHLKTIGSWIESLWTTTLDKVKNTMTSLASTTLVQQLTGSSK